MRTAMAVKALALGMTTMTLVGCGMPAADTPLTIASENGDAATVRTLLARGADANGKDSHGLTPLVRAARRGNYDAAVALLDGGADPNLFDSIWTRPGWSPLMNAVHKSQPRIVKLLIEHGADVNAHTTDGTTPLALSEDKDIADMLVARLDPVSRGPHGQR
jgi:ankyrin repeat protein